ncbi:hypothetical protein ACS0TY_009056 [Phlomoides rotata]
MASKLGILVVVFLSIIFLPMLSSAFIHPGLQAHRHRHRHHHRRHRLFNPLIFPQIEGGPLHENGLIENGDDNGRIPSFLNPALDNDLQENEEDQQEELTGEGRENGDENETTSTFLNPALDGAARTREEPQPEEPTDAEGELGGRKKLEPKGAKGELGGGNGGLREEFYEQSCPQAEKIVNKTIQKHFRKDPSLAAGFVRLFFHDCFVTGCDGSVLLDITPTGEVVEKKAPHNGPLIRGFETIDDIKTQLEAECPGVVSCADILAFATRDSLVFTGVPNYEVEAGRRDGLASLAKNVEGNLPTADIPAQQNIQMFQKKGMSLEDLVVLIGAHSIGSAHCNVVSPRFHDQKKAKEIDPGYLFKMQTLTMCQTEDQLVAFDPLTQNQMDSRYYKELLTKKSLIEADHNLAKEARARNVMKKLVDDQEGWLAKFTAAIKKLGEVEVLTGDQGEIRKQCRAVNGDALV